MGLMARKSGNSTSAFESFTVAPFEHYMYADQRKSHSMTVQMRFWFSGLFDQETLKTSLETVLGRHPIFQMTINGKAYKRTTALRWLMQKRDKPIMPFICWKTLGEPITHPTSLSHFDLEKEIGLRFWIRDNRKDPAKNVRRSTEILVQFHHAVCDGIGMLQFIEDVMIHYGNSLGTTSITPRAIDPSLFNRRSDFWLTKIDWRYRIFRDLKRAFNFFKALAQPLATPATDNANFEPVANLFASERKILSSATLNEIRLLARRVNSSVNDLLLHELFRTLSPWNERLGRKFNRIRIALATSLRLTEDERQSSMNIVSMVFLDKTHKQVKSSSLLASIVAETTDVKFNRMGLTLPRVVGFFGRLPVGLWLFMRAPICSATAVLTNLGSYLSKSPLMQANGKLKVGDIELESYELLPPIRPKTSASFAVNYYSGKLSITLRYDSTTVSQTAAHSLLESYCARLDSISDNAINN